MTTPAYRETQQAIERVFEKQIFFVAGVLKSGTTWLQFLLDAHPEICCKGEGHFLDKLYPFLATAFKAYNIQSNNHNRLSRNSGYEADCPTYTADDVNHVFATAIGLAFRQWLGDADVKCVGEKTPENARSLDFLARIIQGSKFIHIIRDGRDAAVSTWVLGDHWDREEQLKKFPNFNLFIEDFAKTWRTNLTRMQEFGTTNPDRYFELRYEDLHREPEPVVRGVFEFMGVDAGDAAVTDCIDAAAFERLTDGRKQGQEQAGAHMRKGVVGDWRNHFDESDEATFRQHAGTLLKELGYDD